MEIFLCIFVTDVGLNHLIGLMYYRERRKFGPKKFGQNTEVLKNEFFLAVSNFSWSKFSTVKESLQLIYNLSSSKTPPQAQIKLETGKRLHRLIYRTQTSSNNFQDCLVLIV